MSALTGVAAQIAAIVGIGVVYSVVNVSQFLVFVLPGIVGTILALFFVFFGKDADSRHMDLPSDKISLKKVFGAFVFNPRKYPDFGWNWLGRFIFFVGLYFNTAFGTFFYSQRLGLPIAEIAGIVAIIGLLGIVAAVVGAIGGGWLSDKLGRRKLFVGIGAGTVRRRRDRRGDRIHDAQPHRRCGAHEPRARRLRRGRPGDRDGDPARPRRGRSLHGRGPVRAEDPERVRTDPGGGDHHDRRRRGREELHAALPLGGALALVGAALIIFKVKSVR